MPTAPRLQRDALTDEELRAAPVAVTGDSTISALPPVKIISSPEISGLTPGEQYWLLEAADSANSLLRITQKKLADATYGPTLFTNFAADVTKNVKATAGNVFSVSCMNLSAAMRYLQLHQTATVPGALAVPRLSFKVPVDSQIIIGEDFFTANGIFFTPGIAFACSTAPGNYAAAAAGDHLTWVCYK